MIMDESRLTYMYDVWVELITVMCVAEQSTQLLITVWMYFGMVGAFTFILIQLVLIIDFAHSWNESWVGRMEEGESKGWYYGKIKAQLL